MQKAIRTYLRPFLAIFALFLIALSVSVVILREQRLRIPFLDSTTMRLNAEFENAQAVTPGQGQTVQVAGVKIGDIGEVKLKDGRAVVGLDIEPEFDDLVKTDAKATLRPRTGLKDMYIQLDPGSASAPVAKPGFTIPIARTFTDVDLDEILESLDADTRQYLQLLVNGAGGGLRGRGKDLAEVFRRFGPTMKDLGAVNKAVGREREALKTSVNSLARLNRTLAGKDTDLSELVDTSAATFRAFASEERNLGEAVQRLPGTLRQATETMAAVRPFTEQLRPTASRLVPAVQALERANNAVRPFAREAAPIVRNRIRPFVRESRPLVRDLAPAAAGLASTTPELTRGSKVLNTFFNMLGFNEGGRQGPANEDRDEGYLFWLAWAGHQGANLINVDDANGPLRPVFLTGTCTTLKGLVDARPELEFGLALTPILATLCGDPATGSVDLDLPARLARGEQRAKERDK